MSWPEYQTGRFNSWRYLGYEKNSPSRGRDFRIEWVVLNINPYNKIVLYFYIILHSNFAYFEYQSFLQLIQCILFIFMTKYILNSHKNIIQL